MHNFLKQKLAAGGIAKFMSLRQMRTADAAFIVRESGFDGFYIDCEHGVFSLREASDLCMAASACGITPLVRVHTASVGTIGTMLDAGACGIIVPHVSTAADAAEAVALAKYPPLGRRSVAALGPASGYKKVPIAESVSLRNDSVMVIAMIETAEGVKNADAIASVPGIDALMMGPADLSLELGIAGQVRHAQICAAYFSAADAARRHGKHFVAGAAGGPDIGELIARGARIVMGGNDTAYLMQSLAQAAEAMDKAIKGQG